MVSRPAHRPGIPEARHGFWRFFGRMQAGTAWAPLSGMPASWPGQGSSGRGADQTGWPWGSRSAPCASAAVAVLDTGGVTTGRRVGRPTRRGAIHVGRFTLSLAVAAVAALEEDAEGSLSSVARRLRCKTGAPWGGSCGGWGPSARLSRSRRNATKSSQRPSSPPRLRPLHLRVPPGRHSLSRSWPLAGHLARCLEHLASLLRGRGVALEHGPGLAALLRCQFDRWGGGPLFDFSGTPAVAHSMAPGGARKLVPANQVPAMEIEYHQLDLRYETLRRRDPRRERQLLASIGIQGQVCPVGGPACGGGGATSCWTATSACGPWSACNTTPCAPCSGS